MAKRTRVSRSAQRPGTRPASAKSQSAVARTESSAARTVSAPPAPGQPAAAAVEGATLVETPAGSQSAISRSTPGRIKVKPNSLLAARAETEYVYVGRDLRRIAIVGGSLFGVLFLLWFLLVVLGLSGFYG